MKSIFNFQFSIFNSQKGFTLVELLISIVIVGTFGTIVVNILASTFRGSSKTDVINKVRQNGNYAISEMARKIRYAKTFDGARVNAVSAWTCDIIPPPPAPPPAPARYNEVKITLFDGTETTFSCEAETINASGVSLMDAVGPASLVRLSPGTCFFTCQRAGISDSPQVGINFTLVARTVNNFVEKQATIPFKTTIKARN